MNHYRGMPADFPAHAEESYTVLVKKYRTSTHTVLRWKDLCGVEGRPGRPPKAVTCIDDRGRERTFMSLGEAAEATGIQDKSGISAAIRRGGKAGGYRWRHAEAEP